MSINLHTYLPQIQSVIESYGVTVQIHRNVYENVVGIKTLKTEGEFVTDLTMVLDNSDKQTKNRENNLQGIDIPKTNATMYYAYDPNITLQHGDYFTYEGIVYTLDIPVNLVNANLVYQVEVIGEIENGGWL